MTATWQPVSDSSKSLTSGRRLAKNTLWNFGGLAAPLLCAAIAVPILISGMGKDRFALLAIIWLGIGYFSLFDVGLGRALTKLVAEHLGKGESTRLRELVWTANWSILSLGVVAMLGVLAVAPLLIERVFNVPVELRAESIAALRILALGIPVVVLSTALIGILSAHQRFASISVVRALLGTVTFIVPVLTLQVTPSLAVATAALLACRVAAGVLYFILAARARPELLHPTSPRREWLRPLLSMGGWLTVTNLVSPIMVYFDRFLMASLLTLTAVTHYVTPFEVVSKILIVAGAMMGVLFPALATAFAADRSRLVTLYSQASRVLLLVMLPPVAVLFLFAPEGLTLWLGDEFREASTVVVYWLTLGVMFNSAAQTPFSVLQSIGRADLVAKAHLAELVPYVVSLWVFTKTFGIAGAAAAWTLRTGYDAAILLWLTRHEVRELRPTIDRSWLTLAALPAAFALGTLLTPFLLRLLVAALVSGTCAVLLWPSLRKVAAST